MPTNKRSQTFNWLQAILIVMVIDDHVSTRIGFLSSIFPYNSFYMPLFVFISGYFYKNRSIKDNIIHKIRKLFIPYLIWNVIGNTIALILFKMNIVNWYREWNLYNISKMLVLSPISTIVGPGWFAVMLFFVSIAYNILDNLLSSIKSKSQDYILLFLLCGTGMFALWICINHYSSKIIFACRTLFYLQFYHMGYMFSRYWEETVKSWRNTMVCAICIAFNVILVGLFNSKISFIATANMADFYTFYLPLFTSIAGGLFWYEITNYLSLRLGENKLINLLAENTFTIMMSHLLFLNIPNFFVYAQIINGSTKYGDFDIAAFQSSAHYRYSSNVRLIAFFCGLIGSILFVLVVKKSKEIISYRRMIRN